MTSTTLGNPTDAPLILLIESHRELREATHELIAAMGRRVVAISDWSQAGLPPEVEADDVGLLIVDAFAQREQGLDQVDKLRRWLGPIPAILISGYGDDEGLRRRVEAGDVEFLAAPFTAEDLREVIDHAMAPHEETSRAPSVVSKVPAARGSERDGDASSGSDPNRVWKIAAAVVIVVGSIVGIQQSTTSPPPLPSAPDSQTFRSNEVTTLEPKGDLQAVPRRFLWHPFPRARTYRVSLFDVGGEHVWQQETGRPSLRISDRALSLLDHQVIYDWSVEALDSDGVVIGASARTRFRTGPAVYTIDQDN